MQLKTARLTLRAWRPKDHEPLAKLNADPAVMRHFPAPLTRAESDAFLARANEHIAEHGFGFQAVELNATREFIGFLGLIRVPFQAPFTPAVEIGWRLAASHWGSGYATEGASAVIEHGFGHLKLPEILAFTVPANTASRRVMEKLGFRHHPAEDFYHPHLPAGHPLRPHVLYRLRREEWLCYPYPTHHG